MHTILVADDSVTIQRAVEIVFDKEPFSLAAGLLMQFAIGRRGDAVVSNPQAVPFIGGGSMPTHAWQRFHVRYYSMALLFIAFEMEMMFMYPWAVVFVEEGVKALAEMGMFLAIL